MRKFSTVELTQQIGTVTHVASREPVTITQHRKPRFVLMSIEDYERLRARSDTRTTGTLETMPDDLFEEVKAELSRYEQDGERR
jgi:prevent-host-death family protein